MTINWKLSSALALVLAISPAFAQDRGYTYLALGDSIPFGFDPTLFGGSTLPTPADFIGYPEILDRAAEIRTTINASCPGESSGSFIIVGAPDNGCNQAGPQGQPPFKQFIGLHVNYPSSQLRFASEQIRSNRKIQLVTLSIGGNDLSLLQKRCSEDPPNFATCVAQRLPGVLLLYSSNLALILYEIRHRADYNGQLVLMTNYVPNNDPLFIAAVAALNTKMKAVGRIFGAKIADGFTAFQVASLPTGGDPCAAGLLVRLSATTCDIHPSPAGQALVARTVLAAQ